jgi:hypothetical protein
MQKYNILWNDNGSKRLSTLHMGEDDEGSIIEATKMFGMKLIEVSKVIFDVEPNDQN